MPFYYVGLYGNTHQAIVEAKNKDKAERYASRYFGAMAEPAVRLATEDEIEWNKAFGGCIHDTED